MAAGAFEKELHRPVLVPPGVEERGRNLVLLLAGDVHHLLDLVVLRLRVFGPADELGDHELFRSRLHGRFGRMVVRGLLVVVRHVGGRVLILVLLLSRSALGVVLLEE